MCSNGGKSIRVMGNIWENLDLEETVVDIHKGMVPSRTPSTGPTKFRSLVNLQISPENIVQKSLQSRF